MPYAIRKVRVRLIVLSAVTLGMAAPADGEDTFRFAGTTSQNASIRLADPTRASDQVEAPRASKLTHDFEAPNPEQPQSPPQPEHTGLAAIAYKTGADFKAFPRRRSTWVILGIAAAAAALAHPADDDVNAQLIGSKAVGRFFAPGKWIGSDYIQVGSAVGLYAVGRYMLPRAEGEPKTNKVSHLGFGLLRANIVSQALTIGIKATVRRDRPTGECCSFPSGHAAATFATAAVLERHLGYRAAWPTFVIATYVGASRLHDNRHFLSDVLFGAALGTATGWTIVGRHGRSDYALVPVATPGGMMVALVR